MADNVYLLEARLSRAQQDALAAAREVARSRGLTLFLVGGAVRDLIGGTAVRDLDVVVQGSALKLRKDIEKAGAVVVGESDGSQAFFVRFPGGVRMEIGSTLSVTYPKPGKAVAKPASILDDLRRRDFTANAMALSLNEGSYGLLMDPLNGVADIENRELRLVSNYGFIEDPVRMIRAARYMARLGWHMDEKTQARYETGKAEGYISALDEFHRGYETEEIFQEEDALRVMRRLEEEGWMQHLFPALASAKVNVAELERLRESQAQLQTQGVVANSAAANFPYLTAKLAPKEVEALKKSFPRQGFVEEIEALDAKGKEFAAKLGAKGASLPSQAYKLISSGEPESVLWVAHTTKSPALQAKFKSFYTDWQTARQRIPYVQMQEMRITSELPEFAELVDKLFFELMDGKLATPEEIKAFLEPFSPPAPPPPVSLRRPRAAKKEAKPSKSRKKPLDSQEEAASSEAAAPENTPSAEGETSALAPTPEPARSTAKAEKPKGKDPVVAETPATTVTGKSAETKSASPSSSARTPAKSSAPEKPKSKAETPSSSGAAKAGSATRSKQAPPAKTPAAKKTSAAKTPAKAAKKPSPSKKSAAPVKPAKKAPARPAPKAAKKAPSKNPARKAPSKPAPRKTSTKKPAAKKAPAKKR